MTWNNHIQQQNTGQQRQFEGLSEQHILHGFGTVWPWALGSFQVPPAGACTIRLGSEARRKTSPATLYKDLAGCWVLERAPEAAQRSMKLHSPPIFTSILRWKEQDAPRIPFPWALQEESKAKLEDTHTGSDGRGCEGRFHCCLLVLGLEHSLLNLMLWSRGGVVNPSPQKSFRSLYSPKCFAVGCWSEPRAWSVSHLWGVIPRNLCQWGREEDRLLRRLCNCTLTEL